jgi:hypothetical protein
MGTSQQDYLHAVKGRDWFRGTIYLPIKRGLKIREDNLVPDNTNILSLVQDLHENPSGLPRSRLRFFSRFLPVFLENPSE